MVWNGTLNVYGNDEDLTHFKKFELKVYYRE